MPCLVAVCWQTVKPCPIPPLPSGLIEVPALPVASITPQPDRQGQDSSRLSRGLDGLKAIARSWSFARGALTAMALPCQTVKAAPVARALLGGGALADREALPNSGLAVWLDRVSGLARGFDHPPTRPPSVGFLSLVPWP